MSQKSRQTRLRALSANEMRIDSPSPPAAGESRPLVFNARQKSDGGRQKKEACRQRDGPTTRGNYSPRKGGGPDPPQRPPPSPAKGPMSGDFTNPPSHYDPV